MAERKNALVTDDAGFVGGHWSESVYEENEVHVLDDLCSGNSGSMGEHSLDYITSASKLTVYFEGMFS